MRTQWGVLFTAAMALGLATSPAPAAPFSFSTGNVDGLIATASRPESAGKFEIESADDFVLTSETVINQATFTGLLPANDPLSDIGEVRVEIYRVFPADSNVGRTSGPPVFSTSQVPTRVNSPSDVEFDDRDTNPTPPTTPNLTFTPTILNANFSVLNSVKPGGIHLATGGNGPLSGEEVQFNVTFTKPFDLPADHYFFVPQVQLKSTGDFFWLSSVRPIVAPGTPFPPGFTDLQSWTRDAQLDPDWMRVGTDIVGANTFNAAFSLSGTTVPEPSSLAMGATAVAVGLGYARRRRRRTIA
jgi:hypothetical protein